MTMEVVEVEQSVTVFGTDSPQGIVERTTEIAQALGGALKQLNLTTQIQGREYVLAEGWAYLGAMLGVFPHVQRVEPIRVDDAVVGYEATVDLVTKAGEIVGGGSAICTRNEKAWGDRDGYALMSMAQTRATGKAFRLTFGFVMKAAGYEATPAEEMPRDEPHQARRNEPEIGRPVEQFLADIKESFGQAPDQVVDILGVTMPRIERMSRDEQTRAFNRIGEVLNIDVSVPDDDEIPF